MAKDDTKQLKELTEAIQALVNKRVEPVAPVAPVLPIAPVLPVNPLDHDLLTRLDAKVDQIQMDVTALKQQGNQYVTQADHKTVCGNVEDHETRIRLSETNITRIMTWGSALVLLIGVFEFLINRFIPR